MMSDFSLAEQTDAARLAALLAQREQELAVLRACHEDWLRAFSHDLRAPLRHITSYAPLLRETVHAAGLPGNEAQEAAQFLAVIEQAAGRLGKMLDGSLQLVRVLQQPQRLQTVDLTQMAAELRDILLAAESARQTTVVQLPTEPMPLQADPDLLRQMLEALLDNAFKFSRGQSSPEISLKIEPQPDGGTRWQIQDNGVGCDMSRQAALFGLFQRLHRDGEFAGVGVGLAVAQAVARRHGAELAIHSAPGQGCTVVVNWPG